MTQEKIVLYGHNTCPMMPAAFRALNSSKAQYDYINIHQDSDARETVKQINGGYESVPTFIFPDGSTLTEPSNRELYRKLAEFGYEAPASARFITQLLSPQTLILLVVIWAILRFVGVL